MPPLISANLKYWRRLRRQLPGLLFPSPVQKRDTQLTFGIDFAPFTGTPVFCVAGTAGLRSSGQPGGWRHRRLSFRCSVAGALESRARRPASYSGLISLSRSRLSSGDRVPGTEPGCVLTDTATGSSAAPSRRLSKRAARPRLPGKSARRPRRGRTYRKRRQVRVRRVRTWQRYAPMMRRVEARAVRIESQTPPEPYCDTIVGCSDPSLFSAP